jgi:hypothetical protein
MFFFLYSCEKKKKFTDKLISNNEYGLDKHNLDIYMSSHINLSRLVYMWPPLQQINSIGSKRQLIRHLDFTASKTSSLRPRTVILKDGDLIPNDAVIKRSHSDCGHHVLLVNDDGRNWESLNQHPKIPGAVWMAQAYVPTLRSLGEWRVFIVGGRAIYTVHTKYNEEKKTWTWEPVDDFYALEELRQDIVNYFIKYFTYFTTGKCQ